MKRFAAWAVATRLTIVILLVAMVAIALFSGVLNQRNRQVVEAIAVQNLINSSAELGRNLDAFVRQETNRIENLATSRSVEEFMRVSAEGRADLYTPTLDDFVNVLRSDPQYRAVALVDVYGNVLLSTEGNYVGANFSQFAFSQHARATLDEPSIYSFSDEPLMWLSAPIRENGRLVGRVVISVSAEKLGQRIDSFQIGQFGYAILVDRLGKRLAHGRNRGLVNYRLSETGNDALYARLRLPHEDGLIILSSDSGRVYHGTAALQERDWEVVVLLHENEVLAPARTLTSNSLFGALVLVLLLALIVALSTRYLLRSIPELAAATEHIATTGDLSRPITVRASGEIGTLAAQFETMRRGLFDSNQRLEKSAEVLSDSVVERTRELAALSSVVATASQNQSRNDMLDIVLRESLDVMDAQIGGIWLATANGSGIDLAVSCGMSDVVQMQLFHFDRDESLAGHAYATGERLTTENATTHPRLARTIARELKFRAFVAIPLVRHDRNFGVLGIIRQREEPFSPQSLALADSIGQQIALTLDNLDLVEQARTQSLTLASLQERERIAADIHDSMAQTVGYFYLQIDHLVNNLPGLSMEEIQQRCLQHMEVLDQLSAEIRQFIRNLRQPAEPVLTLSQTLENEVQSLKSEIDIEVDISLNSGGDLVLEAGSSTQIARIVGEALRNAARHGAADSAEIHFDCREQLAHLSIRDNGKGFVVGQLPDDGREHFGLEIMQARAERFNGQLHIDSHPFEGTCVHLRWNLLKRDPKLL